MAAAAAAPVASQAQAVLRKRLCDPAFVHSPLKSSPDTNYSKLKYLVASSVSEACNNSVLLLGPRGCGKGAVRFLFFFPSLTCRNAVLVFDEMCLWVNGSTYRCAVFSVGGLGFISLQVLDMVLEDLKKEHPDAISVIRLNGMLHSDDNCAMKDIARQLCLQHELSFSKMASSDDNTEFMIDMLRECGLAHKTVIFILEEFDLFAQGKQRLLYSLLDAMQSLTSQAVVIGMSCRLDADQLLEKRVRSRFSHRKLLFIPSSLDDIQSLTEHLLMLDQASVLPTNYVTEYNSRLTSIFNHKKFKGILNSLTDADATTSNILRFLFRVVSYMDKESGLLSIDCFTNALSCMQRQPKMDSLQDLSILELYVLVCMNRLEDKEQNSYNFNTIMKEYKSIQDAYKTSDKYATTVCFRAFEHLLDRELITFADTKGRNIALEYRPVKLLISSRELAESLKLNTTCPTVLQKLLDRERYM
ncbi:origin of replication complex subunit 4 isoform X1 [Brachypodium distachyon]|uniref:origin of replication complex subunit 4 isoform X1 n=1 Tax=Brachypodium distachyon TaxID=15368 RepID=UPI00052FDDAF|nr:origin of replication complex subunit 4 isoform X1 [Brachypodium distachyon]|eukprot:XP_010232145.1 origin of replication complex subunit 4 isoform X1 [Brachypodium distachyon]